MTDPVQTIIRWIRENCPQFVDHALGADTPLLEEGGLDSLQIVELFGALEDMFGIAVDVEELTPENFETVNHIVAMTQRVRKAAA